MKILSLRNVVRAVLLLIGMSTQIYSDAQVSASHEVAQGQKIVRDSVHQLGSSLFGHMQQAFSGISVLGLRMANQATCVLHGVKTAFLQTTISAQDGLKYCFNSLRAPRQHYCKEHISAQSATDFYHNIAGLLRSQCCAMQQQFDALATQQQQVLSDIHQHSAELGKNYELLRKMVVEQVSSTLASVVEISEQQGKESQQLVQQLAQQQECYTQQFERMQQQMIALVEKKQQQLQVAMTEYLSTQAEAMHLQSTQMLEQQQVVCAQLQEQHRQLQQQLAEKVDSGLIAFEHRLNGLLDASVMVQLDDVLQAPAAHMAGMPEETIESVLKKHVDQKIGVLAGQPEGIDFLGRGSSDQVEYVDATTRDYINKQVRAALQKRMGKKI